MTKGALDGVKIVDLSRMAPGPFCSMMLGDMGAEVIKVEAPPTSRIIASKIINDAETRKKAASNPLNRNKRSIVLDLKEKDGIKILHQLCEEADVFIEGFRPEVVTRLGCNYETIKEINPSIIYSSISGYGQTGPYKDLVGHDVNYISVGGALGLIGSKNGTPSIPYNLIADFAAGGMNAAYSIVCALFSRTNTGRGQKIDTAMSDGVTYLLSAISGEYFNSGLIPKPGQMTLNGGVPYYNVFECQDGKYISLGCIEPNFWKNLCSTLNLEQFASSQHNEHEYQLIMRELEATFKTKRRDEWWDIFREAEDVAAAPVYEFNEVLDDPHMKARNMFIEAGSVDGTVVTQVGFGSKFTDTPGAVRNLGTIPGADSENILREIGYSADEIKKMVDSKVVFA
jgi:crotonobetainyl-CoA:carnitine CoA-transferase CaiB-like acyl-CoA transferase